ncbi:MAG: hypothetical protein GYA35_08140 [Thermoanaerobaculaceae bacterium]|nr:hypothetical protein [Thermoanaerobaculaceae bacterium]
MFTFGQEYMPVAVNSPGFKPIMSYQNFGNGEYVNGFNGGLTVTHSSSISLPQNLGFSLNFTRVYNTSTPLTAETDIDTVTHSYLGAGWNISYGRICFEIGSVEDPQHTIRAYRKNWVYIDESGAKHPLHLKNSIEPYDDPPNSPYPVDDNWYYTNDSSYIRAKFTKNDSDISKSFWTVYLPDGSKKLLGEIDEVNPRCSYIVPVIDYNGFYYVKNPFVNGYYTAKIIDRAGNEINIYYYQYAPNSNTDPYSGQPYAGAIKKVVDQFGRVINFNLTSGKPNNKLNNLLSSIQYPDGSIETFEYQIKNIVPDGSKEMPFLVKVTDPVGLQTLYDYQGFFAKSPQSGYLGYFLYKVYYPTGAVSEYDYDRFIYKYRPCPTEDCQEQWGDFIGVVSKREYVGNNTLQWQWQRNYSQAKWIGGLSDQIALLPVLMTDPYGRETLYFYADEWNSGQRQLVPAGMEVAVVKYNSNGAQWPIPFDNFNPFTNAVYVSKKKFSSNGGDADKCVAEYFAGNPYTPVGNVRVREVYEAELDGNASSLSDTSHILWEKTTRNEVYDDFGHYLLTYTKEGKVSEDQVTLLGLISTSVREYDLKVDETLSFYQIDRLINSYDGKANTIQFQGFSVIDQKAAYPGDPQEPSLTTINANSNQGGGFKAVAMSYLDQPPFPNSGLLLKKSQKREWVYAININNKDVDNVTISTTDPTATITYSSEHRGNISQIDYTGGQTYPDGGSSNSYSVSFNYSGGIVSSMKWAGFSYYEFTRFINSLTGRITSETDANGLTTNFSYDAIGRIIQITPPNGEAPTKIEYPLATKTRDNGVSWSVGNVIKFYKGLGSIPGDSPSGGTVNLNSDQDIYTYYEFDDLGRLIRTSNVMPDNSWSSTDKCYDPLGNVVFESYPYRPGSSGMGTTTLNIPVATGSSYSIVFPTKNSTAYGVFSSPYGNATFSSPFPQNSSLYLDPFLRTRYILKPDGGWTKNDYNGLITTTTIYGIQSISGLINSATIYTKDIFGRLISVIPPEGASATYTYNSLDQLISAQIGSQPARTFSYDALGHLLTSFTPERGTINYYAYDALGNLLEYKDENGVSSNYKISQSYDVKGRLTKISKVASSLTTILKEFVYDESFSTNGLGRLTTARSKNEGSTLWNSVEQFVYDGRGGRLGKKIENVDTGLQNTLKVKWQTVFTYNQMGLVEKESHYLNDNPTYSISSTYKRGALNSRKFDNDGNGVNEITYHPSGAINQLTYSNGEKNTYSFDTITGRLSSIYAKNSLGATLFGISSYHYDPAGNITQMDKYGMEGTETFTYDKAFRLVSADVRKDSNYSFTYGYDAYGNITSRYTSNSNMSASNFVAVYGANNRITSFLRNGSVENYVYDSNGNVTQQGGIGINYNSLNLTQYVTTASGREDYYYDSSNERIGVVKKDTSGKVVSCGYFLRDGSEVKEEMAVNYNSSQSFTDKAYLYVGSNVAATSQVSFYSISGSVKDSNQIGVEGVVLEAKRNSQTVSTALTDSSGNYTLLFLSGGSSGITYSVVPSKTGYTFNPTSKSVLISNSSITGVNFTATQVSTYSISGKVTQSIALESSADLLPSFPVAGVTIKVVKSGGGFSTTVDTNSQGTYTVSGLAGGTYTVTPSKSGCTFSPTSTTVTISTSNKTGINFTANCSGGTTYYTVSGKVRDNNYKGISGINVTLSGAASKSTVSDANGNYSFSNLQSGSYTVTVSSDACWTFSSSSQSFDLSSNITLNDFVGTLGNCHTISGNIKAYCQSLAGVVVAAGGKFTTTNSNGDYTSSYLPNGTYTVFPSLSGYTFSPASYSVTISGTNITGKDFAATESNIKALSSGVPVNGSVCQNQFHYYSISIPSGASNLSITLTNLTANIDLYCRNNLLPTTFSSDGRSTNSGTYQESISINNPTSGTMYIGCDGVSEGSYTLMATVTGSSTYSISGTVTYNNSGLSGVTMTLSGAASSTTTTTTNGTYTFSGLANGTYTVTPSKSGYTFSPTTISVTISGANQTGKNFTASQSSCSGYTISLTDYYCGSTVTPNKSCYSNGESVTFYAVDECYQGKKCYSFNYWTISINGGSSQSYFDNPLTYQIPTSGSGRISVMANYLAENCSSPIINLTATDLHQSVDGKYQVLLSWQMSDDSPFSLKSAFEFSYKTLSSFVFDYTDLNYAFDLGN